MTGERCPVQWHTRLIVASTAACGVVIRNDSEFSDYSICAKMYRNPDAYADLKFTRQFGDTVFSRGECAAVESLPSCSPIRAIQQGSFCQCPAGSRHPVAGCYPSGSHTVCMTSSIASVQCN